MDDQCYHNKFGCFLSLTEYERDVKRGFIAILVQVKGKGWRRFVVKLREATSLSSVLGSKNRASLRYHFRVPAASGSKDAYINILKRKPSTMVAKDGLEGRWEVRGEVVQSHCNLHKEEDIWFLVFQVSGVRC